MDLSKKQQIDILVNAIKYALEKNQSLFLLTESGDAKIFSLQGNPQELTFLMVKAMQQDKRFAQVVEIAAKVYKGETPPMPEWLKDLFKKLIPDNWEPLDCDNCPTKDDCKVRDEIFCEKDMPKELREILDEIFNNPKNGK
jgi:hypothetical protein